MNKKWNSLTLVDINQSPRALDKVLFKCECGVTKLIRFSHVVNGITVSCGCIKRKHHVEEGKTYGRLTVVDSTIIRVGNKTKVLCKCECGKKKLIGIPEIATGITKSCGCLVVEQIRSLSIKHGKWKSPLFSVWSGMRTRCSNQNAKNYHNYGGRGITICPEWADDFDAFEGWASSNGYANGLQIDRVDVNKGYSPDNCRFVTSKVNANNRRNNILLTAFGETKTISEWASDCRCAVNYKALNKRITRYKWPHEKAITQFSRKGK